MHHLLILLPVVVHLDPPAFMDRISNNPQRFDKLRLMLRLDVVELLVADQFGNQFLIGFRNTAFDEPF